jgi:hypothetical protein
MNARMYTAARWLCDDRVLAIARRSALRSRPSRAPSVIAGLPIAAGPGHDDEGGSFRIAPRRGCVGIMNSFSSDVESEIESELVDLSAVPFRELRSLDDVMVARSLRHVVGRTATMRFRRTNQEGQGGRID